MALGKSIAFLKRSLYDKDFRTACYKCESRQELFTREGFNDVEFEDAVNMALVKCQTHQEAEQIQQIKWCFDLL